MRLWTKGLSLFVKNALTLKKQLIMKRKLYLLLFVLLLLGACTSVKNIAYMQEVNKQLQSVATDVSQSYEAKIKPGDLLSITVVSTEPEASRIYNLITPQLQTQTLSMSIGNQIYSQPALQGYLVDKDGIINFPVLGHIQAKNMTKKELENYILEKLKPAFINELPIVTIRINNYSINVLGEVNSPGNFTTVNERLTIFEGLALAGDMTIYGKRDNVKVLREDSDGNKTYYTLNLNDRNIINSPAYFLQQNDVVYVEPNQSRANSSKYGAAESYRITTMSVLISLATMAVTIFAATK